LALLLAGGTVAAITDGTPALGDTGAPHDTNALDDQDITLAIETELLLARGVTLDPIDVETHLGVVTLSGSTDNILAKERAGRIASMVKGVRAVVNHLSVKPAPRPDDAIRTDVVQALTLDPATESWEVGVTVEDGAVTLSGEVDSWQEKHLAARVAKGVRGVRSLDNQLRIDTAAERPDLEIEREIESAHLWDVRLDDALIDVSVEDGEVTLSGSVGSAYEKNLAIIDSWVRGVRSVNAEKLDVDWLQRDEMLRQSRFRQKTDEEIGRAVRDAWLFDPRVASFRPQVDVHKGVVTLTGVVDNLKAKRAAAQDAANTSGVWRVKNYLKVRPVVERADTEVAEDIRSRLLLDPYVDRFDLTVTVDDGVARLSGEVDSYFEKWQAEDVAARTRGVVRVEDRLEVGYEPLDYEVPFYDWDVVVSDLDRKPVSEPWQAEDWQIRDDIRDELFWSPFVDADQVSVAVTDGVATLTGTVDSFAERSQATEEALEGGALVVDNDLRVLWGPDFLVF
jgi:osmotically-inducible protein OsmY